MKYAHCGAEPSQRCRSKLCTPLRGERQVTHENVAKMRSNNIAAYCFTLDLDELHEGHAKRIRICEKH